MIIGVILTILLLFLVPVVLKWMKVQESDQYTAPKIFTRAGELVGGMFNLGNIIKQSQEASQYKGQFYQDITPSDTALPQPISNDQYNL